MAYNNLGLTFQPGQTNGGSQNPTTPVQRAVQLLSLRLPSVVGARSVAPQALLGAGGGAGVGAMAGGNVEAALALLRRLQQQSQGDTGRAPNGPQDYASFGPAAGPSMAASFSTPLPRVIPSRDGEGGTIQQPATGTPTSSAPRDFATPDNLQPLNRLSWTSGGSAFD